MRTARQAYPDSSFTDSVPRPGTIPSFPELSVRHLFDLRSLTKEDILAVFQLAIWMRDEVMRPHRRLDILANRTIVNLFAESSTRTRSSFELAERRLGAQVLNFNTNSSSFTKGETLLDTVLNLEAMHVDAFVIRHAVAGVPNFLAERCTSVFINAGDGRHEHPTQGLLDTLTLFEHWGGSPNNPTAAPFSGKRVTIVGDIMHGRVALSNIYALQKLGAEVAVCAPPTLIPRQMVELGVRVFHRLDQAIEFSDALNMLRIQKERQDRALFPSMGEYSRYFGLNKTKIAAIQKDIAILHPGPINRGIELDGETADGPKSLVMKQVENGVAVRMAVLAMLLENSHDTVTAGEGN